MMDKQAFVVGTFSYVGSGAIHALINNDSRNQYHLPYGTLCGSHLNIGHGNSSTKLFAKPTETSNLWKVTCKSCLDILILKGLLPPKETKESNMSISATIRLKTGPVTIVGSYRHTHNGEVHAVVEDGINSAYRTLCGTHQISTCVHGITFKAYNMPLHPYVDVTCKRCLRIMGKRGPRATEINSPGKPKQKKFFLATFDDGDMEIYNSLAKLQDKMKQYREEIIKVQIVDSYRTISMKTVLVDEDGKEITERSLE